MTDVFPGCCHGCYFPPQVLQFGPGDLPSRGLDRQRSYLAADARSAADIHTAQQAPKRTSGESIPCTDSVLHMYLVCTALGFRAIPCPHVAPFRSPANDAQLAVLTDETGRSLEVAQRGRGPWFLNFILPINLWTDTSHLVCRRAREQNRV